MTFHEACRKILAAKGNGANLQFAKSYASAGLKMDRMDMIHTQAVYIRANITHWRDPDAKQVRGALDQIINAGVVK